MTKCVMCRDIGMVFQGYELPMQEQTFGLGRGVRTIPCPQCQAQAYERQLSADRDCHSSWRFVNLATPADVQEWMGV